MLDILSHTLFSLHIEHARASSCRPRECRAHLLAPTGNQGVDTMGDFYGVFPEIAA